MIRGEPPKVVTFADLMREHGVTAPTSERVQAQRSAPTEPRLAYDAYPLARRVEALDRATQNRERHVQRMARWLAKNIHQALRFTLPTQSRQRCLTRPGDLAVEDAARLCLAAFMRLLRRDSS